MTPTGAIAALDRSLAKHGQDVVLTRLSGTAQTPTAVTVRAMVRGYAPHELVPGSGLTQGDSMVIISPTQINAAGWPGAGAEAVGDVAAPRKGDTMLIAGRTRSVLAADPIRMNDVLVRINLSVRG